MNFCNICENMLYLKNDSLKYYCRNCGEVSESKIEKCVYTNKYTKDDLANRFLDNPHILTDPTLPKLKTMKCINVDCETNTNDDMDSEIIYIKYNHENLKYLYICTKCKSSWKNK